MPYKVTVSGVMGVPITFLDHYNPEQFEIIGADEAEGVGFSKGVWHKDTDKHPLVNNKKVFKRILIKRRQTECHTE